MTRGSLIGRSERFLERQNRNGLRVGALFGVFTATLFVMDQLGFEDLSSPWLALSLAPLALIYLGERLGHLGWFSGLTLPTLLVLTASVSFVSMVHSGQAALGILAGVALVAALCFMVIRLWTYEERAPSPFED